MTAGPHRVQATFWLLEAPDSLAQQSHREPDGTGLGWFDERGLPAVSKQPLAAFNDFNKAISLRPDSAQGYYNRGLLYQGQRQHQYAIDDFSAAIGLTSNEAEPFIARGQLTRTTPGWSTSKASVRLSTSSSS